MDATTCILKHNISRPQKFTFTAAGCAVCTPDLQAGHLAHINLKGKTKFQGRYFRDGKYDIRNTPEKLNSIANLKKQ